jgi:hypothetical protein
MPYNNGIERTRAMGGPVKSNPLPTSLKKPRKNNHMVFSGLWVMPSGKKRLL